MEGQQRHTHRYPANWNLRFVCDCRKAHPDLRIYPATAKQLSPNGTRIQSKHHVCPNKSITLKLDVPSAGNDMFVRTIEIIGRTIYTEAEEDHFLTEIEFVRVDKTSRDILTQALSGHFEHCAE